MPLSPSKASSELHSNAIFTSFLCHSRLSELLTYFVNILTNDAWETVVENDNDDKVDDDDDDDDDGEN